VNTSLFDIVGLFKIIDRKIKKCATMPANNFNIKGLTNEQVIIARDKYGLNQLLYKKTNGFLDALKSLVKEPMLILLLAASSIYFFSGYIGDGIFMLSAIVLVSAISLYQDSRSRNALKKLKNFTQPYCKVFRNGVIVEIQSEELVVGDSLMVEEGTLIAADGVIEHSNDFSVNESILTGESFGISKDKNTSDNSIYLGTSVVGGLAIATITAVGNETRLGKIGKSLEEIQEEKTPLELQINNFVKKMVLAGAIVFLIAWAINYYNSHQLLDSLLKALTLAMSILPEEIPVAFTSFMALGAWRLMKLGIVVKQMKTVETLGSASVICTDKTGTITENKMSLAKIYVMSSNKILSPENIMLDEDIEIISLAMWASEPIAFDPMEVALHSAYERVTKNDERPGYKMIHEYPLSGVPPMMTHIFENSAGKRIIAAKGAPEALMILSNLTEKEKQNILEAIKVITKDGCRVLAIGEAVFEGKNFAATQQEYNFKLKGIAGFYDPPKTNIKKVLEDFYAAGIAVKIITGDNTATTSSIAKQIAFKGYEKTINGEELLMLSETGLKETVANTNIFTRMFPDAKLRIINALKEKNEIVAMTGDGVNDGLALKAAHIGIAMGKKGSEIAKQAASLILTDDDLSKMVDAVAIGRKIYANLKKAIQYIISIHIPIVLTVFIPLALGWRYPNIFSPVHIIFLELIMGPTCSIIYENEPMEKNTMQQKPRPFTNTFFNWTELSTSIVQGLMITCGTLLAYRYAVQQGYNEALTRTMVFIVLIAANIFLTLVNRSFYYSVFTTIKYKNNLVLLIIGITIGITALLLYVKLFTRFFGFEYLNIEKISICTAIGFLCVIWYEFVKLAKRKGFKNE
jgi:P-type Ca2+ transporter type 2C